tara:strand:- start:38 stop:541 length:504 start_codon:yes stop_codon:yes gene_type:complete
MESEYLELVINNRLIKINKNDSMDVYSWRECKTKPSYWNKIKPTLLTNKYGYQKYRININTKTHILSRVTYKAHNKDWDINDNSDTNIVDHINNNSLDNRIQNLRILTAYKNRLNNTAKGYYWNKKEKKWQAQITFNGKKKTIGYFKEEEDAHQAYLTAKEKYHIIK